MTTKTHRTYEEIIAEERASHRAYEASTVAAKVDGQTYTIAELRGVFEAVEDKDNWKRPWAAAVPADMVRLVIEAVVFFHADRPAIMGIEPLTGRVLMEGKGYQG